MKGYAWVEDAAPVGATGQPEPVEDQKDVKDDMAEEPASDAPKLAEANTSSPKSEGAGSPAKTEANGEAQPMDEE